MNKRYSITGTSLAIIIIIVTGTIALSLAQAPQTASAQLLSIWTKVVRDDQAGNAVGWNPDGLTRSFTIIDQELTLASTVLINTHQDNFVVCSVDYRPSDIHFEVNCIETTPGYLPTEEMPVLGGGPADGAILYYTVIQAGIQPLNVPTSDVLAQAQNMTAQRMEGGEEPPE
jgi:hypothetical protein